MSTGPADNRAPLLRWFVPGDLDGFFGLFVDNLSQLMVVVGLCPLLTGLPSSFVVSHILPGIAASLLAGNLFYAWQARRLSRRTGRAVTALPFGVNTISLFTFILLIMHPVYVETGDATLAWNVALTAGFLGGVIEIVTSFFGEWIRRHTPRAALLSALAGAAITFISMGFVFQIFSQPLLALFPALLILIGYGGRIRWPGGLPTGLIAIVLGTGAAWTLRGLGLAPLPLPIAADAHLGFYPPIPIFGQVLSLLTSPRVWSYASFFIPMAILNVIGSIQNLESAEAAGDRFFTRSSLLANGVSALVGVFLGNPFAPTIYIGHPAWKAIGARSGYSVLNAVAVTLVCLTGALPFVLWFVPLEVTLGILLWLGLLITAQAFQEVPRAHAPAVAFGFIPSLAAWGEVLIETALRKAGSGYSLRDIAAHAAPDLFLYGLLALAQGFILTSIFFSALTARIIDRQWRSAAVWALLAASASAAGLIHAYTLTPTGFVPALFTWQGLGGAIPGGLDFALVYLTTAGVLWALSFLSPQETSIDPT